MRSRIHLNLLFPIMLYTKNNNKAKTYIVYREKKVDMFTVFGEDKKKAEEFYLQAKPITPDLRIGEVDPSTHYITDYEPEVNIDE